ncbi:hypothetical protein PFICI_02103 [Pestalotiopsis fici W106-1]|uniref:Uncharacterized protein n=1 Tax=Pestalotiopsis fici (strain W106-1 / CGMCC3.15140) TaxID=1229662 RepID=W3XQP5_PESFW|nr:uncharacterized protein PFICI_02103 [Pestalotiopsis fici W106-1]ETS88275.1 hypothetical protein PFICI_02103 [Pestalotiopsis fici W106-1]
MGSDHNRRGNHRVRGGYQPSRGPMEQQPFRRHEASPAPSSRYRGIPNLRPDRESLNFNRGTGQVNVRNAASGVLTETQPVSGGLRPVPIQRDTQHGHARLSANDRGSQFGSQPIASGSPAKRGRFTARRGNAHVGVRQGTLPQTTTVTNAPVSESDGDESRPIVLESTPPLISDVASEVKNAGTNSISQGVASTPGKSSNVRANNHARPTITIQPKEREESSEEEPSPLVSRAPSKRKSINKSPTYVEPTDAWWLPAHRKIRLLEICISFESEYFLSNDSEMTPDQAF